MSGEANELEGRTLEENVSFLRQRVEDLEQNRSNTWYSTKWCFPKYCSAKVNDIRWAILMFSFKYFLQIYLPLYIFGFCLGIAENVEIGEYAKDKDIKTGAYESLFHAISGLWVWIVFPYVIADMWDNYIKPFIKKYTDNHDP